VAVAVAVEFMLAELRAMVALEAGGMLALLGLVIQALLALQILVVAVEVGALLHLLPA
jgi:hypothetical protein